MKKLPSGDTLVITSSGINNMQASEKNIWGSIISLPESTKIGSYCDIGDPNIGENCKIQCHVSIPPGWKIGNNVFIGPGAHFANDKHPSATNPWKVKGGVVEDDASIGMGALILPGVKIGKGAIVGAGAVVVKSVQAGQTVVGNPARVV